jgi:hypothetical protein
MKNKQLKPCRKIANTVTIQRYLVKRTLATIDKSKLTKKYEQYQMDGNEKVRRSKALKLQKITEYVFHSD